MESISLKLDAKFLKDLEKVVKNNRYSTKTEFVREAIRDKINEIEKREMSKSINKLFGSSKHKTTDKNLHKARKELIEIYEKKFK